MLGEYAPLTPDVKRKILGLNAARLYDLEVPAELAMVSAGTTGPAIGSEPVSPV
jgi:hypothetical protein